MRRILPLLLCALVATPFYAHASEDEDVQAEPLKPKKKKKKIVKRVVPAPAVKEQKGETRAEDVNPAAKKPEEPAAPTTVVEEIEVDDDTPSFSFKRHRYAYFLGAGFVVAGLAFAYSAQGEAKRAETILTARESSAALDNARASAATSNVMYALGGVTIAVALIFELLPEPLAEKASLTFHF